MMPASTDSHRAEMLKAYFCQSISAMHVCLTNPNTAGHNRGMAVSTFPCPIEELHIEHTVICGQAFRWKEDKEGWWACLLLVTGTTHQTLVRLKQNGDTVTYQTLPEADDLALVRDYFRLDLDLSALSREFAARDPHIQPALADFPGLRVVRQDPTECLFSFLCTPASPLHRIRRSITAMCRAYGEPYPGGPVAGVMHYGFPSAQRLADAPLTELTGFGLGFRARYIQGTAQVVVAHGGSAWLNELRHRPYAEAKAALMTLPGVGEKIADCICLFSLDKDDAIPVDTHIRQIAQRRYLHGGEGAAKGGLTKKGYQEIGDLLRERFGPMAGWAQQYLFFGDLYQKGAWEAYTGQVRFLEEPNRRGRI
jgi:N-glycosylase/DNA lyase